MVYEMALYKILQIYKQQKEPLPCLNVYTLSSCHMTMWWQENTFFITGPLWGESTGHQWIPLTNDQ